MDENPGSPPLTRWQQFQLAVVGVLVVAILAVVITLAFQPR